MANEVLSASQQIRMWAVEAAIKAQVTQPTQIVDAAKKFADFTEGKTINGR